MTKHKWLITLIIILAISIIGYNYIYQNHRNIETENAHYVLSTKNLIEDFNNNSIEAEKKFLNKTIEITGIITNINSKTLTLDNSVFCQFTKPIKPNIKINSSITVKGRFIGFDDLVGEIKLDQCSIIN